ncbi:hypothetical protein [Salipiger mucosus]|uniref:Uncharacterized protein n=1 Tax=Salipiger mucosus DSM 16094 TaxID=1123237 RepID=S9Q363_9RHOB|nr:hypothetical protein [Salipiger mucosus]EPX75776.1 hypothetical protein Salmuc_05414 [Salipiger mucosus DSM 16094]
MLRLSAYLRVALAALIFPLLVPVAPALAQGGPPVIEVFRIERAQVSGRAGLAFTWQVENVGRVRLLHDGREVEARIQLPDGSFGWPPDMPGAFRTTGTTGTYTLIAENARGRVEARGSYRDGGCFAWLVPPGTHWTRCRRGGLVASNLSTTLAPGPARCNITGSVTSSRNFRVRVRDNPLKPASGSTTYELDTIWYRRAGRGDFRPVRLSGRGPTRSYPLNNLSGGFDYEIALGRSWPSNPAILRIRCPDTPGTQRITARRLHNTGFHHEY